MKVVIVVLAAATILLAGILLINQRTQIPTVQKTPTTSPNYLAEKVNYTASFTIITGNITRSFKAEKYHNKSADVYIENPDPSIVNVKKAGITWDDFFKTLPMKLTKECLTTGDGETFCDGKAGSLKFYLNDIEDKDLLDKEIKQNDQILVKFTSK